MDSEVYVSYSVKRFAGLSGQMPIGREFGQTLPGREIEDYPLLTKVWNTMAALVHAVNPNTRQSTYDLADLHTGNHILNQTFIGIWCPDD